MAQLLQAVLSLRPCQQQAVSHHAGWRQQHIAIGVSMPQRTRHNCAAFGLVPVTPFQFAEAHQMSHVGMACMVA